MRLRFAPIVAVLLAMLFGIVGTGCGLPVSGEVEYLENDEHLELLNGTTSTTVLVAEPGEEDSTPVRLFFIGPDGKLEFVVRPLPAESVNNDVLTALESGPIEAEIAEFETLQTFIPAGLAAQFGTIDLERGSMPIIVDPEGGLRERLEGEPDEARLIISQLVCTVLSLNLGGVQGVEIYDGGEDALPLSDNAAQPIIGPAKREDFGNCVTGTDEREQQREEAENESDQADTSTTTTVPQDPDGTN